MRRTVLGSLRPRSPKQCPGVNNMKHVLLTASVAALLLVGLTAPLVMAKPTEDRRGDRDDMRQSGERPMKGMRASEHANNRSHRQVDTFLITVSAQGISQDNHSYTITGEGTAIGKTRDKNDTMKAFAGFAKLNVTLKDENGTVVKEGTIRVRLIAHQNETGDWHWRLVSAMKTPRGMPKIFLHGDNVTLGDGSASLDGKGFALVKVVKDDDTVKRLRLKLDADIHIAKA